MSTRHRLPVILDALSKGRIGARALARRCVTSVRTLYRDIQVLRAEGFEVGSVAGRGGGFWLDRESKPAHIAFSTDEVREVVLALAALGGQNALPTKGASLIPRLLGALPSSMASSLNQLLSRLEVQAGTAGSRSAIDPGALANIERAISERKLLWVIYDSARRRRHHVVEPEGLRFTDGVWMLVGWDRREQATREYRLDCVHGARVRMTRITARVQ